jgi:hypothetical protein
LRFAWLQIGQIDRIRKIGNIGTHMEHDVDNIIDIEEDEFRILTELVELLFGDWYVGRDKRKKKFS